MKLFQYIKGHRRGKDINRLEKEAMRDPFLADALDGFDRVNSNDHERRIQAMRAEVLHRVKPKKRSVLRYWGIAASILLIVGFGGYFLLNSRPVGNNISEIKSDLYSTEEQMEYIQSSPESASRDNRPEMESHSEISSEKPLLAHNEANNSRKEEITSATDVWETPEEIIDEMQFEAAEIQELTVVPDMEPEPVIGRKEYEKYLKNNIILPQSEDCKGKKGKVALKFAVNEQGRPVNIRIEKSLCPDADREAIRLIQEGSDWMLSDKEVEIEITF